MPNHMLTDDVPDMNAFQEALKLFFRSHIEEEGGSEDLRVAQEKYRLSRFTAGVRYSRYVCEDQFDLKGKKVLDLASAWGGHALAFADHGADVIASDLKDHRYFSLQKFAAKHRLLLSCLRADCRNLPFRDSSFDVILALDLIEHIDSVSMFAHEVQRLLRPGGVCILTTPPRLRSLVQGEPHWGLRGITLMPLKWQETVARKVFRRDYPYAITRQYIVDSQALRPFTSIGLQGKSFIKGRLLQYLDNTPILLLAAQKLFWDFLLVQKLPVKDENIAKQKPSMGTM